MDLSAAVTIQRPGKAPLDINTIRDPELVGNSPLSGYSIEYVDFSFVGISAFVEDIPQVDGVDGYEPYLGSRVITMAIAVYGATYGIFWDNITQLLEALQPRPYSADTSVYPALGADGTRKLSFKQPRTSGEYNLYMMVRPAEMPRFTTDKSAFAGNPTLGYATMLNVMLTAEDPYKYYQTAQTFTRTGSGTISVINTGATVAWPTVSWANGGSSSSISATLGSDTVSHSSISGTTTDTFKTATSTSPMTLTSYSFFHIPPGTSAVSVTAASAATVSITIREAIL